MPKDPVAVASEFISGEFMDDALARMKEHAPHLLEGPRDQVASNVRKLAKSLSIDAAKQQGGVRGFVNEAVRSAVPTDFFGIKPLGSAVSDAIPTPTIGNALDLFGVGPESVRERPLSSVAGATAAIASSFLPQAGMVGRGLSRVLPLATKPSTVIKGEQILRPALAAGAAGGTTQFGSSVLAQINGVPETQVRSDSKDPNSYGAIFTDTLNAARNEFLFEAGGGLAAFGALKLFVSVNHFIRGDREFFENSMESLKRAGIKQEEFGLQEVSDRILISSASGTIGILPVPLVRIKFQRAKEVVSGALARVREKMFSDVSPRFSLIRKLQDSNPALHDELLLKGEADFFRQIDLVRRKYGVVRAGVSAAVDGGIAREALRSQAASTRLTALSALTKAGKRRMLPKTAGKDLPPEVPIILESTGRAQGAVAGKAQPERMFRFAVDDPDVEKMLRGIRGWTDDSIKLSELIELRANLRAKLDISDIQSPLSKRDRTTILSLESALDLDIDGTILRDGSEGLNALYTRLKALDGDWITLIAGHVGRRSKRVQQTFGKEKLSEATGETVGLGASDRGLQRHQGPLDMSDFMDSMLNNASPEEIRQLGIFMRSQGAEGVASMRFALARELDKIIQPAIEVATDARIEVTRADVIEKMIFGGKDRRSKKALRFWALTREAGVSRELIQNFTEASRTLWRQIPKDPSQFMTRSFILSKGNPKSLLKMMSAGVLGGATVGGSITSVGTLSGALMGWFTLNRYAALVTSPKALAAVIAIIDPKFGTAAKARAIDRLAADNIFREWFGEKNAEINARRNGGPFQDFSSAVDQGLNTLQNPRGNPLENLSRQASDFFDRRGSIGDRP